MKVRYPTLDNIVPILVSFLTACIVTMVFVNYAACNFKWPLSVHYQALVAGVKKDYIASKCDETTSQSIQTLMGLLATIIALKADLRKKEEKDTSQE